ncbi:MAG: hypothetical protein PUF50_04790 [Erysipelotrichaceae bacterium]|nr:hypothetical protein [Erysipelotrichaceae bacterium]
MAVCIEIKQKNKSSISAKSVAQAMKLEYGIYSNNFVLEEEKTGRYTILFDPKQIGRGIEFSEENQSILLRLSLPSTVNEIALFYRIVAWICKRIPVFDVFRNGEAIAMNYLDLYMEQDKSISLDAILDMEQQIQSKKMQAFTIFGAKNPIILGTKEFQEIQGSLEGFKDLLHRLQEMDVYYADPVYYQRKDGTIFASCFIGLEIETVIPKKRFICFNPNIKTEEYYVMLPEQNCIRYEDFIKQVTKISDYDTDHITIRLTEEMIEDLIRHYTIDLMTGKPKEPNAYWGKLLDIGENHRRKIQDKHLPVDEIAAWNHIAIYFRWCMEHGLLSERLLNACPQLPQKEVDLREWIRDQGPFHGNIRSGFFEPVAKNFSRQFYNFQASNLKMNYPQCVDQYAEEYFGTEKYHSDSFQDEAYLFVPYNEEYYIGLTKYIDQAWYDFIKQVEWMS